MKSIAIFWNGMHTTGIFYNGTSLTLPLQIVFWHTSHDSQNIYHATLGSRNSSTVYKEFSWSLNYHLTIYNKRALKLASVISSPNWTWGDWNYSINSPSVMLNQCTLSPFVVCRSNRARIKHFWSDLSSFCMEMSFLPINCNTISRQNFQRF